MDPIYLDVVVTPAIDLDVEVESPIILDLSLADPIYINMEIGLSAWANLMFGTGVKQTGVDAGILWQQSLTDDYRYVCVQGGVAGVAIWKKQALFHT